MKPEGGKMITCGIAEDVRPAVDLLAGDVLRNNNLLAIVRDHRPPVPHDVWVAQDDAGGRVRCVMVVQRYPGHTAVDLTNPPMDTDAVCALIRRLEHGTEYQLVADEAIWEAVGGLVGRTGEPTVSLRMVPGEGVPPATPSGLCVRHLGPADTAAAAAYPPMASSPYAPTLARWLEWALASPHEHSAYAAFEGADIVGALVTSVQFEHIWEVANIHVPESRRRQGIGRAMLAHVSARMAGQGRTVLYVVNAENEASVRTVLSVGFHEAFRLIGCAVRVR
jgi:ribosomal protein S18 acetylase RimI-like enzyme